MGVGEVVETGAQRMTVGGPWTLQPDLPRRRRTRRPRHGDDPRGCGQSISATTAAQSAKQKMCQQRNSIGLEGTGIEAQVVVIAATSAADATDRFTMLAMRGLRAALSRFRRMSRGLLEESSACNQLGKAVVPLALGDLLDDFHFDPVGNGDDIGGGLLAWSARRFSE